MRDTSDALLLLGVLLILLAIYLLAGFPWLLLTLGFIFLFAADRLARSRNPSSRPPRNPPTR